MSCFLTSFWSSVVAALEVEGFGSGTKSSSLQLSWDRLFFAANLEFSVVPPFVLSLPLFSLLDFLEEVEDWLLVRLFPFLASLVSLEDLENKQNKKYSSYSRYNNCLQDVDHCFFYVNIFCKAH